jgi:hypothetical protein
VYVVVDELLIAGDHVPDIPSFERSGSVNNVPAQTGETCAKVGVVGRPTITVIVAVVAHCPRVGIKV